MPPRNTATPVSNAKKPKGPRHLVNQAEDLGIGQASELIDELKGAGSGGRR